MRDEVNSDGKEFESFVTDMNRAMLNSVRQEVNASGGSANDEESSGEGAGEQEKWMESKVGIIAEPVPSLNPVSEDTGQRIDVKRRITAIQEENRDLKTRIDGVSKILTYLESVVPGAQASFRLEGS